MFGNKGAFLRNLIKTIINLSGNFQSRPPMTNVGDSCLEVFKMKHKYGHKLPSTN